MPQSPLPVQVAKNPSNVLVPLLVDASGNLLVNLAANTDTPVPVALASPLDAQALPRVSIGATSAALNITAATAVKASPGRVMKVSVIVAGSADGAVYDHATTSGVAAANQIAAIPQAEGVIALDWPCSAGITVVPGTGQTVSVSYV